MQAFHERVSNVEHLLAPGAIHLLIINLAEITLCSLASIHCEDLGKTVDE